MLKFPLRVEYALRALMDLASRTAGTPVPARAIAERQRIPVRVLEHQLAALNKAGIVGAQRGAHGGYELARAPSDIRISDVIGIIEGPIAPMYCLDPHEDENCSETHRCGLQHLWIRVENAMREVFETTTLTDLVEQHRALQPLLWPTVMTRSSNDE